MDPGFKESTEGKKFDCCIVGNQLLGISTEYY